MLCFSDDLAVIAYRPGASRSAAVGPIRVTPARHAAGADPDGPLTRAVAAAQQGDEAAFTQVYRAVQPGLLRYLTVLVGADAEDVASETWAQVCRDFSGFKGDADGFRAWTATIGRHRAMDHLRARARRPVAVTTLDELMAWPARDDTAGGALEALSTTAALRLIGALPRDQAEAVLLRAVVGLDANAAGRVLGKRAGAVRTAAYRGLRRLAEQHIAPTIDWTSDTSRPLDAETVR